MPSNLNHSSMETANAFMAKIEFLVKEIIIQNNISCYRVESLMEMPEKVKENNFVPIIRVVTYFEDAIPKIAALMQDEFDVMSDPAAMPTQTGGFSYKQIHFAATFTADRMRLTEYKRMGSQLFEIQICSILQDAWKGMERELGYDKASYPEQLKRDLFRVGALLEMADLEFSKIKALLSKEGNTRGSVSKNEKTHAKGNSIAKEILEDYESYEDYEEPTFNNHSQVKASPVYIAPTYNYLSVNNFHHAPQHANGLNGSHRSNDAPKQVRDELAAIAATPTGLPEHKAQPANSETVIPEVLPMQEPVAVVPAPAAPELPAENNAFPAIQLHEPIREDLFPSFTMANEHGEIFSSLNDPLPESRDKLSMSTLDMNVLQPEMLAMNVGSVGESNSTGEQLPDILNQSRALTQTGETGLIADSDMKAPADPNEGMALNIDNVETFNLNVNGMIERRTEVVIDRNDKEEVHVPFFERDPNNNKPAVLDEQTLLSDTALREYVATSTLVKEVDSEIARRAGAVLNSDVDVEGDVERLKYLKVFNLKQLHERISDNKADIVAFAEKWIGTDNGGSFDSGICLFYLEYLLVGKRNDPAFAVEYVLKFISDNDYSARFIIPTYNSISKNEMPIASHLTLK